MQVEEVMSRNCRLVNVDDTLQKAARIMREENVGVLPVQDPGQDRLVGVITDRDIVTRVLARGGGWMGHASACQS